MGTQPENGNPLNEMLKTLISVIEDKDQYIKMHSERVAATCVRFATHMGISRKKVEKIHLAALLHDVGMVYIPKEITRKPGKLTENERLILNQHPVISEKILSKKNAFNGLLPLIRHHHEAFDGSGYPDSLKGNEISIEVSILSLINSYEAMISARAHRPSLSREQAINEIKNNAGHRFESILANAFVEFIESSPGQEAANRPDIKNGNGRTIREMLLSIVKKANAGEMDLPILPQVIQGIQKVMDKPNAYIDEVTKVIERDAAISIKLIAMANSPIYRGAEKIDSVRQAIPRLGVKETQDIVKGIANQSIYKTSHEQLKILMEKLWLHSLACAYASKNIAQKIRPADIEKIFLMGLIHDIGKTPLIKILNEMLPRNGSIDMDDILSSLQEVHASFGGALLKKWGFAQGYKRVATRHEGPIFSANTEDEVLIVSLANKIVHKIGYGLCENGDVDLLDLDSAKLLQIDKNMLDEVSALTDHLMQDTADIFSPPEES